MRKPSILFLCSGNSCRSQMAEAFAKKYGGEEFDVHSAGLRPTEIHPLTKKVLEEAGLDISDQFAKGVDHYLGKLMVNYLFIVCDKAAGSCPTVWPGANRMERIVHAFEDPAAVEGTEEEKLTAFRRVRDEIGQTIKQWIDAHRAASERDEG
jgi:arsenate reductase (thioredoxin)